MPIVVISGTNRVGSLSLALAGMLAMALRERHQAAAMRTAIATLEQEVSERRRFETDLRIARDAAESATRAKSAFLANIEP